MAKTTSKHLDIWKPVVAKELLHHNYRMIMEFGSQATRDVLTTWADGFRDRDGKFVQEFQRTFDSAFWELYLYACFKELGLSPQVDQHAPDFMLKFRDGDVAAEATIAREADGYRPEWDKDDLIHSRQITELAQRIRYTTVRLASRFVSKVNEYRSNYAQLAHVKDKPFLLCIAPFDQPFTFDLAQQAMRRVLYRADTPIIHRHTESSEPLILGISEVNTITKDSGAEFPLGYFCDAAYSEVSAVLFSTTATWSKVRAISDDPESNTIFRAERFNAYGTLPLEIVGQKPHYRETLLDGLILCLNPFADRPLDTQTFLNREIAIDTWDVNRGTYYGAAPHEWLVRRFCFTAREVDDPRPPQPSTPNKYKDINKPEWPNGELRKVPVIMWPASTNWMAHYDGWTIVVLHDGIDGTWHAFAVHQIAHTVPEVRDINLNEEVPSLWRMDDHVSRDAAFDDIKNAINKTNQGYDEDHQQYKM